MNIQLNGVIASAKIVNVKALEQSILEAFAEWAEEDIDDKYMSEQFEDQNRWPYPPPVTVRKNGETAGNPRNIYDTGALFRSGQETFKVDIDLQGAEASWHWNAKNSSGEEYAWFVHEGKGPHSRAPRPWTDELSIPFLFQGSEPHRDLERRVTDKLAR